MRKLKSSAGVVVWYLTDYQNSVVGQMDASGAIITGAATGDLYNADATPLNLDVLNDNGGAGFTHMLLAGSVAIDAGDPAFATPPDFDQRGNSFPRVLGRRLDIGAVESPSARLTITLALQGRSNPVPHPSYGIIVHTELRSTAGVARVIEDHVASMGGQVILLVQGHNVARVLTEL